MESLLIILAILSSAILLVSSIQCVLHYTGLSSYKQDLYLGSFLISEILLNIIFHFKNLSFLIVPMVVYLSMELLNYGIYYTTIFDNKWTSNFFKGFACIFFVLVACTGNEYLAILVICVYAIFLFIYAAISRLNVKVFIAIEIFFMLAISFIINASIDIDNVCESLYISNSVLIAMNVVSFIIFILRQKDYHSIVNNI